MARVRRRVWLTGIGVTPYPHFSWQIGEDYDLARLETILQAIAVSTNPFEVRTTGIGLFTGESPVIYIPVVKDKALLEFHHSIWEELGQAGKGISDYYAPDSWMPHISLAYEDVTKGNIGDVMKKLAFTDFNWQFQVDNIALIHEPLGQTGQLKYRYDFKE